MEVNLATIYYDYFNSADDLGFYFNYNIFIKLSKNLTDYFINKNETSF